MKNPSKIRNSNPGETSVFEILVSTSLFLVFLLVIGTGVLSYFRLNHIIDTVKNGTRPDRKLILVKEIYNDLSEAENSVKSYSLTRSQEYMLNFYRLTEATGYKVDELTALVLEEGRVVPDFDSLDYMVEEKFNILDKLLMIQDEFRVQQAMQQVMKSIREKEKQSGITPVDTVVRDTAIAAPSEIDSTPVEEPVKKENFFKRLFRKKDKEPVVQPDTVVITKTVEPVLSLEDINREVSEVQQVALSKEKVLRQVEWDLLQQDKFIMDRIRKLLSRMEIREKENLLIHTMAAEEKANEVKIIVMAFGLSASLLLLLASLVIYRYARRNNEYRFVLNKARKDAEELARAKEMFLANMSHEIRTPMNIISGFLDQIIKGKLDSDQSERIRIVKKSSDHLIGLLNDLLDLSKLQADKLELVENNFSLPELIDDLTRFLEPAASEKDLEFSSMVASDVPATLFGDATRLRQILLNLLGNAIKFTDNGKVTLEVFIKEKSPERVILVFQVTDTGIGIPESDLEKIFREFDQGTGIAGKKSAGTGLGLSITRRLVDLLGGSIRVASQPGSGSVFTVEIPYRTSKADPSRSAGKAGSKLKALPGLSFLVVDDEEYNRRLIRIILEKYGCRVMESESAEDALESIQHHPVDIVLMDIRLPGMKGEVAAGEIKKFARRKGKTIPVIALSAAITKGDLEKFRLNGIDDFIAKPMEEDTLIKVINRFLAHPPDDKRAEETILADETLKDQPDYPESGAGYDLTPLKDSTSENEAFFREMVSLFLRNTDAGLARLSVNLENKAWEDAAELAHKISSPCKHIKAIRLYSLLKKLEQVANEQGQQGNAMAVLIQARQEFEKIKQDIILKIELKETN